MSKPLLQPCTTADGRTLSADGLDPGQRAAAAMERSMDSWMASVPGTWPASHVDLVPGAHRQEVEPEWIEADMEAERETARANGASRPPRRKWRRGMGLPTEAQARQLSYEDCILLDELFGPDWAQRIKAEAGRQ